MLNYSQAIANLNKLQTVSNNLAEQIHNLKVKMEGRGVNPRDAPIFIDQMNEIEAKLRILGSNPDNPIPFER